MYVGRNGHTADV